MVGGAGPDGVGVPDVVRLPGTGRSAVEDQVGAVILDHDLRRVGTRFWDQAGRRPVGRCRFVVGVIGRVVTGGGTQAHEIRSREPVVGSGRRHQGGTDRAWQREVSGGFARLRRCRRQRPTGRNIVSPPSQRGQPEHGPCRHQTERRSHWYFLTGISSLAFPLLFFPARV